MLDIGIVLILANGLVLKLCMVQLHNIQDLQFPLLTGILELLEIRDQLQLQGTSGHPGAQEGV